MITPSPLESTWIHSGRAESRQASFVHFGLNLLVECGGAIRFHSDTLDLLIRLSLPGARYLRREAKSLINLFTK
jgi:hypothetical protein